MKLGVLTTGYPHESDRASGAFVRELCIALVRRGHTVDVVCAEHASDRPRTDVGVTVHPVRYVWPLPRQYARTFHGMGAPDALGVPDLAAWWGALMSPIALGVAARKCLRHCDALISHFAVPCGFVAGLLRDDRPHLAIVHGTDGHLLARAPPFIQSRFVRNATCVWFSHRVLFDALDATVQNTLRDRAVVAPMGFWPITHDTSLRARMRSSMRDRLVILSVGRFVPLKGQSLLVEAAARSKCALTLVFAGDGPTRTAVSSLAHRLGVDARFVGSVSATQRDALLQAADIFVHSATTTHSGRTEGAPAVIVEAMGAGLPVVATNVGGCADLLGDTGLLVQPDNASLLCNAIERLRENEERMAMGRRTSARAQAWNWAAHAHWIEKALS